MHAMNFLFTITLPPFHPLLTSPSAPACRFLAPYFGLYGRKIMNTKTYSPLAQDIQFLPGLLSFPILSLSFHFKIPYRNNQPKMLHGTVPHKVLTGFVLLPCPF